MPLFLMENGFIRLMVFLWCYVNEWELNGRGVEQIT